MTPKEERFNEVHNCYRAQVAGQSHRLLECHEDAEDAEQDIWLRTWQHLSHLNGCVGSWLNTVTRNRCIDIQRSRRYAVGLEEAEWALAPDTLEEQVEHRMRLQQGLARLTPVQRERLLFATLRCRDWAWSSAVKSYVHRDRSCMEEEAC